VRSILNGGDIVAGREGYADKARSYVCRLGLQLAGREAMVETMGRFM
jgi:hypothetical protein